MEDKKQKDSNDLSTEDKVHAANSLLDVIQTLVSSCISAKGSNTSTDKTNDAAPQLEELKKELQAIKEAQEKQNEFNRKLYSKLQDAQDESIRRDLINSIINIHTMMDEQLVWIKDKLPSLPKDEQLDALVGQFLYVRERINDILTQTYNLEEIIPKEGSAVNPKENKIVASHMTNDPDKHLVVCNVISSGYRNPIKGNILSFANVETWRYEEPSK